MTSYNSLIVKNLDVGCFYVADCCQGFVSPYHPMWSKGALACLASHKWALRVLVVVVGGASGLVGATPGAVHFCPTPPECPRAILVWGIACGPPRQGALGHRSAKPPCHTGGWHGSQHLGMGAHQWPTSAPPCALRGTGGTNGTPCRGPTWSTRGASHCCRTAARSGYYYGGVVVCLAQKRPRCASKCCDRRALHQATKVPPCAHAAHPTKTDEPTMVVPI